MRIVRALAALAVGVVAISMAPNGAAQPGPTNPGPPAPKDAKAVQTPCELRIGDAPIRAIVSGADLQNLAVQGCGSPQQLAPKVEWIRDVSDVSRRWEAKIHVAESVPFLELRGAAPASGGTRKFELGKDDTAVATLTATVVPRPVATAGPMDIQFEDPALNVLQSGRSRIDAKSGKPIAVAGGGVWNSVSISLSPEIPSASRYSAGAEVSGNKSHYEWSVKSISARDAQIPGTTDQSGSNNLSRLLARAPGEVTGVAVVSFRAPWASWVRPRLPCRVRPRSTISMPTRSTVRASCSPVCCR